MTKRRILTVHSNGQWIELITIAPEDFKNLRNAEGALAGVPVMYCEGRGVWPPPAEGWTLWVAEPLEGLP